MKAALLIITIVLLSNWPLTFFQENKNRSLAPHFILEENYQGRQEVLRNINLYPNIYLARFFQNKILVVSNKYFDNFFSLVDPNYYLFGSHPREVINGQNYIRLPLLSLIPILWFLTKAKHRYKKTIFMIFGGALIFLPVFSNYYQYDLLLWACFVVMVWLGLVDIYEKK